MSSTISPPFDVEDLLGDDILGDEETSQVNQALVDAEEALDDADEPVEDIVQDAGQALDDADEPVDDVAEDAGQALDEADEPVDDVVEDAGQALDDADEPAEDIVEDAGQALDDADEQLDDVAEEIAGDDTVEGSLPEDLQEAVDEAREQPAQAAGLLPDATAFGWLTPLNNSGAQALARLALDGDTLRLQVEGSGFAPGQSLDLALHGLEDGTISGIPDIGEDADGNGLLAVAEIGDVVGGLLLALGTPVADAEGDISFDATLTPDAAALDALQDRLAGRYLVAEGLDPPGEDGFDAALPAAGGRLIDVPGELGAVFEVLTALVPDIAGDVFRALLDAQAPYTLAPDGEGAIAPEPGDAVSDATRYVALVQPVNNSGVLGAMFADLDAEAGTLEVDLELGGLTPGEHAAHIHGFPSDVRSLLANLTLDADADGFVESGEGASVVGPVLLALTEDGTVSDATLAADFPVADEEGRVSLQQSYAFDLDDPGEAQLFSELQDRLAGRLVQVHGQTTTDAQGEGTGGEVSGEAGFQPALPVAAGALLPVAGASGILAAGVAQVIQAELRDEEPTLEEFLAAIPGLGSDALLG